MTKADWRKLWDEVWPMFLLSIVVGFLADWIAERRVKGARNGN